MAKKDYYDVLGVERGADEKAIKRAYKKLAMQYHPDRTKGDKAKEEKFKEIQEAYEILGDKEKRAAYDQYGHAAFEQGGMGGGGFGGGFSGADFGDIFGDMFGDIFGGGTTTPPAPRPLPPVPRTALSPSSAMTAMRYCPPRRCPPPVTAPW